MRWSIMRAVTICLLAGLGTAAQAQPADIILTNGKIVTVDDPFTIAESLAIRGKYVRDQGLGGVMAWELSGDDKSHTLGRALWKALH